MNLKVGLWSKIKLFFAFAVGDMTDILSWSIGWFNVSVLQKIKDPEEARLYCQDVKDFATFLRAVLARHSSWMLESKRAAFVTVIDLVDCLAAALEDLNVTREELTSIVDLIRKSFKAWKEA